MDSIFNKDPTARPTPPPYSYARIEKEVAHIKNQGVSRWRSNSIMALLRFCGAVTFVVILGLFFLDPFVYTMRKTQAIRSYLYMRTFGEEAIAEEILHSGFFTPNEITALARKKGNFRDYFADPASAKKVGLDAVTYIQNLHQVEEGKIDRVDLLTRIRFLLFNQFGLNPPTQWETITPYVDNSYQP